MSSKLEILFNLVLNGAYHLRRNNIYADGLSFWKPIKEELSQYDSVTPVKWKKIKSSLVKKYMSIGEYIIDGNGNKHTIEVNHFLIQQVRIPTTEKATIRKVVQLGLNIGQFLGSNGPKQLKSLNYDESKLDQLSTYISKSAITKLSKAISDESIDNIQELIDN